MYLARPMPMTAQHASALTRAARNDLYQDQVNEAVFMRPGQALTQGLYVADEYVLDGTVEGSAFGLASIGRVTARLQNGQVRSYAGYVVGGTVVAVLAMLASRM